MTGYLPTFTTTPFHLLVRKALQLQIKCLSISITPSHQLGIKAYQLSTFVLNRCLGRKMSSSNTPHGSETQPLLTSRPDGQDGHHLHPHSRHPETNHIALEGESGRIGFRPTHFLKVLWRSSCTAAMVVNLLWPIVPLYCIFSQVFIFGILGYVCCCDPDCKPPGVLGPRVCSKDVQSRCYPDRKDLRIHR